MSDSERDLSEDRVIAAVEHLGHSVSERLAQVSDQLTSLSREVNAAGNQSAGFAVRLTTVEKAQEKLEAAQKLLEERVRAAETANTQLKTQSATIAGAVALISSIAVAAIDVVMKK